MKNEVNSFKNIIGNILLFMPFGLFVTAYLDVRTVFPTVILTFISSVSVEVVQKVIGRVFDVDDIILNVIGGFIGYIIYSLSDSIGDTMPKIFKSTWFLNILSIFSLS